MKVMQLYSDRRGSELAARASARLRKGLDSAQCMETVWNAELLRSPKLRLMAAREAAAADFVLIAVEEGQPLSPEVKQWLQLWRNRGHETRSTLVALLQRDRHSAPRPVERKLKAFAKAARMDFFCHSKVQSMSRPRSSASLLFLLN